MTEAHAPQGFLFDLGGVLVQLGFEQAVEDFLQRTPSNRETVAHFLFEAAPSIAFEEGRLSPAQYFSELRRALQFDGDFTTFVRLWNAWVSEAPRMAALVMALKARYAVGIISNTNILHVQHLLSTCSFLRHVDRCVTSCAVGSRKPGPRIYDVAIERLGLPRERIIYVDDRPECTAQGRRMGLQAIQFTGHEPLVAALRQMGVAWNGHHG